MSIEDEIFSEFIARLKEDPEIPSQIVSKLKEILFSRKNFSEEELEKILITGIDYGDKNQED